MSREKRYWHLEVGFNYRMTNLQAAVGVAQLEQFEKARQAQSTPEMVGHVAAGLLPVAGPIAAQMGEQIGTGDPEQMAQATGHGLALLAGPKTTSLTARGLARTAGGALRTGQRAASSIGRGVSGAVEGYAEGGIGGAAAQGMSGAWRGATDPTAPIPLMVKALKPRNTKIRFEETGKPVTNAVEFLDAVKTAKKTVRAEYDAIQGPRREIGSTVDGTPIADAMVESIPKKTRLESPSKARAIEQLADTYRQPFKLEDMEVLLQDANAELQGFYDKFPMARNREAQFNPEIAPVLAQAREMRNAIYKVLDNPEQTAVARDLQRQYGALMEVENTAQRRAVVANRQQPESLSEQVGQVRAAADIARGVWKLARFNPMGAADIAAGVAGRSMGKFLKEQQTMDALIRRSMSKYTKVARPIDMPPQRPIAGLLPPAVQGLDAAPEVSGPSSVRGQYGTPSYSQRQLPPPTTRPMGPIQQAPEGPSSSSVRGEYARPSYTQRALPAPAQPLPATPDAPSRLVAGQYGEPVNPSQPSTTGAVGAPAWVLDRGQMGPAVAPPVAPRRPVTPQLPPPVPSITPLGLPVKKTRAAKAKPTPTPAAPAPAVVTPAKPKAVVAKPEAAAAKVLRQIDHVIDVRGAKSAGDLHGRVMSGLAKQVAQANTSAGFNKVQVEPMPQKGVRVRLDGEVVASMDQYGKVRVYHDDLIEGVTEKGKTTREGPPELVALAEKSLNFRDLTPTERMRVAGNAVATAFSRMRGAGQLTVRIPGDGVFTVENNPYAITELMERIRKGGRGLFEDWRSLAKAKD